MTQSRRQRALLFVAAILAIVVLIFPIYWILLTSILPTRIMQSTTPPLLPPILQMALDAYVRVFELRPVLTWILNSAAVTVPAVVLAMCVSSMAGYSLSRLASRFQLAAGYSLFVIKIIPTTLLVIPLFLMFGRVGMIDNLASVAIAVAVTIIPFATWLMKSFFDSIPEELEHAAMVDGCSRLQAVVRVVLPLSRPGLAAIGVYASILAWGDLVFAQTLLHGGDKATVIVGVVGFVGEYTVDWSALMAAGFLAALPMMVIFILLEPLLVSGLTGGAVKN